MSGGQAGVAGGKEDAEAKRKRMIRIGLHFCKLYRNLVKYNPEFCDSCPFNGLRDT